jgi:hypothetical protein
MNGPAVGEIGGPVGGRPQQRVVKTHPGTEFDDAVGFGRRQRVDRDAQFRRRPQEQRSITDRFGGCKKQQPLGLGG